MHVRALVGKGRPLERTTGEWKTIGEKLDSARTMVLPGTMEESQLAATSEIEPCPWPCPLFRARSAPGLGMGLERRGFDQEILASSAKLSGLMNWTPMK